jgi:hypothetical protein
MRRVGQSVNRARTGVLAAFLAALALGACIEEQPTEPRSPLIPPEPPDNPQILSAAWTMDVFRNTRTVRITAPKKGIRSKADLQLLADYFGVEPGSPDLSILADDAVEIIPDNTTVQFSTVGQFIPGQVRTTFDVSIRNKLSSVNIITPTFPAPPPGTSGVILFPFEIVVTQTPGQVTGNGGTTVLVELPNRGLVAPSVDWDVAPFNFFNDTGCGPTSNDCYRSETFSSTTGTPMIAGGATSQKRNIGFDHDPTVSQFRARLIVAGDLEDATPNILPTATAGGPYTGNVPNAVPLNGSGTDPDQPAGVALLFAWDFDNDGQFDDSNSATGPFTCTATGAFPITLRVTDARGGTDTDASSVTCGAPVNNPPIANAGGPYNGVIGGPSITVTGAASTDAGGAIVAYAWDLDNDGAFDDATGVTAQFTCTAPAGAKTIRLQVTDNGTPPLTGVASAIVNCAAAAPSTVRGRWVDGTGAPITTTTSGSTIFLEIDIQLQGSDNIDEWQAVLQWGAGRLTATTTGADLNCSNPGGQATCPSGAPPAGNNDVMAQYIGNNSVANQLTFLNGSFAGSGTGIQGLARLQFTAGTAGPLTPTLIIQTANGNGGTLNLLPTLVVSIPSITIN